MNKKARPQDHAFRFINPRHTQADSRASPCAFTCQPLMKFYPALLHFPGLLFESQKHLHIDFRTENDPLVLCFGISQRFIDSLHASLINLFAQQRQL